MSFAVRWDGPFVELLADELIDHDHHLFGLAGWQSARSSGGGGGGGGGGVCVRGFKSSYLSKVSIECK